MNFFDYAEIQSSSKDYILKDREKKRGMPTLKNFWKMSNVSIDRANLF